MRRFLNPVAIFLPDASKKAIEKKSGIEMKEENGRWDEAGKRMDNKTL